MMEMVYSWFTIGKLRLLILFRRHN